MNDKVTMKIDKEVHKKLLLAKVYMDKKTFDDVIGTLVGRYLELMQSKGK